MLKCRIDFGSQDGWLRAALWLVVLAFCVSRGGAAERSRAPLEELKAAYLHKFLLFVEWPQDHGDGESDRGERLRIAVVGDPPMGAAFAAVNGKPVVEGGPVLTVHDLGPYREDLQLVSYDLVYVQRSERRRVGAILSSLSGTPVLTVSDIEGFVDRGGMIGLVTQQQRLRWEIDFARMSSVGLRPSSQLLRAAVRVADGVGGEGAPR